MGDVYKEGYGSVLVKHGLDNQFIYLVEETYIYLQFNVLVKLCDSQVVHEFVFQHPVWVVDDRIAR